MITIVINAVKLTFDTVGHVSDDIASRRFAVRVAELMRTERTRKGISMRRLAQKSGLSQPTISYIERGLRIPSLDTAYRIADALEVDLSKVIKRASSAHHCDARRKRHN